MKVGALYVYLIGRHARLKEALERSPLPAPIEPDRPLSLIAAGKLAAVTSQVPLDRYGESRFEAQLRDPAWAADRVMRHLEVALFFGSEQAIVPIRFGVMYSGRDKIQKMLRERAESLTTALARVDGCEEWELNLYVDKATLSEEITKLSPKLVELQRKAGSASEGQRYLLEKQLQRVRAGETKTYLKEASENITGALEAEAKEMNRIPISDQQARQTPALAGRAAYLVARLNVASFRANAEKIAARHASSGIKLELTGPWPTYNFVE